MGGDVSRIEWEAHTIHTELILILDPALVHTGDVGHPDAMNVEAISSFQQLVPQRLVQFLCPMLST